MQVRAVFKETVNLGPIFGSKTTVKKVSQSEVYPDHDNWNAVWSKSETYQSMWLWSVVFVLALVTSRCPLEVLSVVLRFVSDSKSRCESTRSVKCVTWIFSIRGLAIRDAHVTHVVIFAKQCSRVKRRKIVTTRTASTDLHCLAGDNHSDNWASWPRLQSQLRNWQKFSQLR